MYVVVDSKLFMIYLVCTGGTIYTKNILQFDNKKVNLMIPYTDTKVSKIGKLLASIKFNVYYIQAFFKKINC